MWQRAPEDNITRVKQQISREMRSGTITSNVIHNLTCLGQIRHQQGEYVRAHRCFRRTMELCTQVESIPPLTMAQLLSSYGGLMQDMGHVLRRSVQR